MKDSTVIWLVIWVCTTIASVASKNKSIMVIPSFGMLIWWLNR